MSYLKRIKQYFYTIQLNKAIENKKITRRAANWEKCIKIGFLFDANDPSYLDDIINYSEKLAHKGREISLLGYLNRKEDVENNPFPYFHNKHISFNYLPKGKQIDDFVQQPFDLLINFFPIENLSLEYISTRSKARCRIGTQSEKMHCFDMVINTENNDFQFFVRQIELLLSKMNQKLYESTV